MRRCSEPRTQSLVGRVLREIGILRTALAMAGTLFLLSCAIPLLERAHDPRGFTGGVGFVGDVSTYPDWDGDPSTDVIVLMPGAGARYCWDSGFSLSLQAGAGPSWSTQGDRDHKLHPAQLGANAAFGAKLPIGQRGALKLNVGALGSWPWDRYSFYPAGSLSYLHDLGDMWTLDASIGFPVLAGLGVVMHIPIGDRIVSHVAIGTSALFSAGLGFGMDFVGDEESRFTEREH